MPVQAEEVRDRNRLLKLALGIPESRACWTHPLPGLPPAEASLLAFEQRWFGPTSLARVRELMAQMRARYDAFPPALHVLQAWPDMDTDTRRCVCHWHLQLSDPIYRAFTGDFLPQRRGRPGTALDRPLAIRWMRDRGEGRWRETTLVQFGSKLLSAASEAGLISPRRDPRRLLWPAVPDVALAYLLYLLRDVRYSGTLTDNPYLRSVGLSGGALDDRLATVPGWRHRRLGDVHTFDWDHADLAAWAEHTL